MSEIQKIISELLPCPTCQSVDMRCSDIGCATGHGVVVRYWVRCLDCGASIIADTQFEADTLWNSAASTPTKYQPEFMRGKPLLQRYDESGDYDREMGPQNKGEYVLYGDHCFYVRSLKAELAALREDLATARQLNVQDLRQAYELGYIDGCRTPDEIRSDKEIREERLKYMLARAAESGASE